MKQQIAELEKYAIGCVEKLTRVAISHWQPVLYENHESEELSWRKSALEQLVGELDYWLGNTGVSIALESHHSGIILVDRLDFWKTVDNLLEAPTVLVDLGSGVRPWNRFVPSLHICVEAFTPYQEYLRERYNRTPLVIINDDVLSFLRKQPDESIHTLVANDLIEHLEKTEGIKLIKEVQRVVKHQALIFTPYGYMKQHISDGTDGWGWDGNALQTHLSGWMPEDFPGWQVVLSNNYHDAKDGHEGGAFAAIYKPKKAKKSGTRINLIIADETLDPGTFVSRVQEKLGSESEMDYRLYLPPQFSPGSHLIKPKINKISIPTYYVTFNLEIFRPESIAENEGNSVEFGIFGLAAHIQHENDNSATINFIISEEEQIARKLDAQVNKNVQEIHIVHWICSNNVDQALDKIANLVFQI